MGSFPRFMPTAIRAPHGATKMEIVWADGHTSVLDHRILRGYCPCAHCQGHGGSIRFVDGGSTELRELSEVGSYALSLTWGDRHDTGIYSYRYLRSLEGCTPELGPLERVHANTEPSQT